MNEPGKEKRYIVRKFIMAGTAAEAIAKEGNFVVDEVFLDDEWIKNNKEFSSVRAIGFSLAEAEEE